MTRLRGCGAIDLWVRRLRGMTPSTVVAQQRARRRFRGSQPHECSRDHATAVLITAGLSRPSPSRMRAWSGIPDAPRPRSSNGFQSAGGNSRISRVRRSALKAALACALTAKRAAGLGLRLFKAPIGQEGLIAGPRCLSSPDQTPARYAARILGPSQRQKRSSKPSSQTQPPCACDT